MLITLPLQELIAILFAQNDSLEKEKRLWARITPDYLKIGEKILITKAQAELFQANAEFANLVHVQKIEQDDLEVFVLWTKTSWNESNMKKFVLRNAMTDVKDEHYKKKEEERLAKIELKRREDAHTAWRYDLTRAIAKELEMKVADAELYFDKEYTMHKEAGVKDLISKIESFLPSKAKIWKEPESFLQDARPSEVTFTLTI